MNREMILRVADAIEEAAKPKARPKFGFNMSNFGAEAVMVQGGDKTGHDCRTVGCIAGWAVAINEGGMPTYYADADQRAKELFGIDEEQADGLFWAFDANVRLGEIRPDQAVKVLRHLAETGEVDWSLALGREA